MQQSRNIVLISALFLTGFLLVLLMKPAPQAAEPKGLPPAIGTTDGAPDICRYWQPWITALAPHRPGELMATITQRSRSRAARTPQFEAWAAAAPRRSEHVCATGKTIDGRFTLDLHHLDAPTAACTPSQDSLDFAMAMHVERSENSRNLNKFEFTLATSTLSASRLRALIASQLQLLHRGYPAWQSAFPDFSNESVTGIGIGHVARETGDGVAVVDSNINWNPQRFWEQVPVLATWLLNLGALVSLDTTITDGNGLILADIKTSTGTLGTRARFPLAEKGLIPGYFSNPAAPGTALTPSSDFQLVVSHRVAIGFKGLNIVVNDLRFRGDITQSPERMSYRGIFTGIGAIDVTGDYKGLAALGMGDMIRKMIREAIEKEVEHLTRGNNGEGWTIAADLAPSDTSPAQNEFKIAMAFESPVHITEIMRFEADTAGGPVLPNQATSYEFRNYSETILSALWRDSLRFRCGQH